MTSLTSLPENNMAINEEEEDYLDKLTIKIWSNRFTKCIVISVTILSTIIWIYRGAPL